MYKFTFFDSNRWYSFQWVIEVITFFFSSTEEADTNYLKIIDDRHIFIDQWYNIIPEDHHLVAAQHRW